MVCIKDLRLSVVKRPRQGTDAKVAFEAGRDLPAQDQARDPVNDGYQVNEPRTEPKVSDVRAPHLVWTDNAYIFQQIPIYFVPFTRQ